MISISPFWADILQGEEVGMNQLSIKCSCFIRGGNFYTDILQQASYTTYVYNFSGGEVFHDVQWYLYTCLNSKPKVPFPPTPS